jgi:hypothetical protein
MPLSPMSMYRSAMGPLGHSGMIFMRLSTCAGRFRLRFPYVFIFSRSHYLIPHPVASSWVLFFLFFSQRGLG